MPSSDPAAGPAMMQPTDAPDSRFGAKALMASVVILLVGASAMYAVGRGAPAAGELPLLPPLDADSRAGAESLTIAASPPPSTLGSGVVAPADEAPAYRLRGGRAGDVVTPLTAALGITPSSESRLEEGAVLVVDAGSDRVLKVEDSPGHPWNLMRGDPDCFGHPDSSVSSDGTISCPDGEGSSEAGQVGGSEPSQGSGVSGDESSARDEQVRCPPVECPEGQACAQVCPEPSLLAPPEGPSFALPPPQAAETRAREVLQTLGLEVARSTLSVSPDGAYWQVLAELSVGGIAAVGMDTQLSIGEDAQVIAGSGMIPDARLLGSYPLISADEALTRLQQIHSPNDQPQFDGREPAVGVPEPMIDYSSRPPEEETAVTGMRLVLLLQTSGGGPRSGAYLVPAFLLDASDGSVFTVPAAIDEHLTPT